MKFVFFWSASVGGNVSYEWALENVTPAKIIEWRYGEKVPKTLGKWYDKEVHIFCFFDDADYALATVLNLQWLLDYFNKVDVFHPKSVKHSPDLCKRVTYMEE